MRGLHFIRLMKAMLENGGSLPVLDADYMCPEAGIADVLKLQQHHAISINAQTEVFTFNTPADRIAAQSRRSANTTDTTTDSSRRRRRTPHALDRPPLTSCVQLRSNDLMPSDDTRSTALSCTQLQ